MKICLFSFEGHGKDGEASAGGKGDAQTNAFTSEGIKPWALRRRGGIELCIPVEKTQKKHFPDVGEQNAVPFTVFAIINHQVDQPRGQP